MWGSVVFLIGQRVDIEEHRTRNMSSLEFRARVAPGLRQIPRCIGNAEVGLAEMHRKPIGGDERARAVHSNGTLGSGSGEPSHDGTGRFFDAQEFGIEQLALIARPVIGEDRHDGVAWAEIAAPCGSRPRH